MNVFKISCEVMLSDDFSPEELGEIFRSFQESNGVIVKEVKKKHGKNSAMLLDTNEEELEIE